MTTVSAQGAGRRAVNELAANGATFTFRPAQRSLPPSFFYEIPGTGDRRRCRAIIVQAKADPLVWAAVLAEIEALTQRSLRNGGGAC